MAVFHTFMDSEKRWRWHLQADNNRIIADSGQSYEDLAAVRAAAQRVKDLAPEAVID